MTYVRRKGRGNLSKVALLPAILGLSSVNDDHAVTPDVAWCTVDEAQFEMPFRGL